LLRLKHFQLSVETMGTEIRLRQLLVLAASAASILIGVAAQTWSKCDPTKTGM
jgi:hypothetical protein